LIVRTSSDSEANDAPREVHPLIAFERVPEHRLSVDDNLSSPATTHSRRSAFSNRPKWDANGLSIVPAGALQIRASRGVHERALRILQALLTGFEAPGFPVPTTLKASA
jgi:hypothetical protein